MVDSLNIRLQILTKRDLQCTGSQQSKEKNISATKSLHIGTFFCLGMKITYIRSRHKFKVKRE